MCLVFNILVLYTARNINIFIPQKMPNSQFVLATKTL